MTKKEKKKEEKYAKDLARILEKALLRLEAELDDTETKIPVNYLTTVIKTLYEKKELAEGDKSISINIKLPEGIEKYAD